MSATLETCPGSGRAGMASVALYSKVEDPIDAYCLFCGQVRAANDNGALLRHNRPTPARELSHA